MSKKVEVYSVLSYIRGSVNVKVNFPNGDVCCKWCPLFLRYEDAFKRYSCRLTHEWILDPAHQIGDNCPIKIKTDKDGVVKE